MTDMTVRELYDELSNIVDKYGDLEVVITYDSGLAGTHLKKKSPIFKKQPMRKYCKIILEGF